MHSQLSKEKLGLCHLSGILEILAEVKLLDFIAESRKLVIEHVFSEKYCFSIKKQFVGDISTLE